jgi:hypothetical protein
MEASGQLHSVWTLFFMASISVNVVKEPSFYNAVELVNDGFKVYSTTAVALDCQHVS